MKRGEVYYIKHGGVQTGSEMYSGRPGIIVSDNHLNNTSTVVEVVYLTTRPKTDLPTHTVITSCPQVSTSLCEQISSVAISRITADEWSLIIGFSRCGSPSYLDNSTFLGSIIINLAQAGVQL